MKAILNFLTRQQNGNLASGLGFGTALLIALAGQFGIPLPAETAAAIVASIMSIVAAGKKDEQNGSN